MLRPVLPISQYRKIVVLTGAGVSVASGLRTYRGAGGLWTSGDASEELATDAALREQTDRVLALFAEMRADVLRAEPNATHAALAAAERAAIARGASFTLLTQNVDGLHRRAGSENVVELHGTLLRSKCMRCGRAAFADTEPRFGACDECGQRLRPDVVLFGEYLAVDDERAAKEALRGCDLFIAAGTSGTVSPASNFVRSAAYEGADTVFVNLEAMEPHNAAFREVHLGRAEEVLPRLLGT
jgi:NAD-dependent deacetylase